ncbi:hypothetical protein KUCAC02_023612, partial [Chaenocephalus aceratus]
ACWASGSSCGFARDPEAFCLISRGSAWRLKRSAGVRLLFYLSVRDLVTGRGLQAAITGAPMCVPLPQLRGETGHLHIRATE